MKKFFAKFKKILELVFFVRHTLGIIGTVITAVHWMLKIPMFHHILTSAVGLAILLLAILSIVFIEKENNDTTNTVSETSQNDSNSKGSMG
jgi:hypothetical protein